MTPEEFVYHVGDKILCIVMWELLFRRFTFFGRKTR